MKTDPGAIRALEDRAGRALAHEDLAWLRKIVPSRFHDDPAVMAEMLKAAAQGDPALANSPPFEAASAAIESWAAGRLDQEISALVGKDKLTPAEDARLTRLAEAQIEHDTAAERETEAGGAQQEPLDQEYRILIGKDKLTPAEDAWLTRLVEARIEVEAAADGAAR